MAVVATTSGIENIEHRGWIGPWYPRGQSISLYGEWQTYGQLWRTQPNVRTVVSFLARNIAQLGLKVFRRVSDDERTSVPDHPLTATISKPNPRTTRYRAIYSLVSDLAIYDNAFWLKVKRPGGVDVYRIPPEKVYPGGENWLFADSWIVRGAAGEKTYSPEEIVHFNAYNPEDPRVGVSPLESLRRILAEEEAAGQYREGFWRNAARYETVLKHPGKLRTEAAERLRGEWEQLYTGAAGSGKTAILEEGMEVEQMSFSAKDSQYLEVRKLSREEVAAAYHIPPPMVGVLDHATFANIEEQHRMLYQDTLGPWLQMIQEEIELQLVPEFDDTNGLYVEFNLADKMQGSFEQRVQALSTAVGRPWLVANEARAMENKPPLEGGNELITPLNVTVGGQPSPQTPKIPPKSVETVLRDFFARQSKTVLSKLGDGGDPRMLLLRRWNEELAADLEAVGVKGEAASLINTETFAAVLEGYERFGIDGVRDVFEKSCNGRASRLAALISQGGSR